MSSATVDKINYLLDTKEEIRQAIVEKYVDVPTSATFRSYADSIRAIPTGNKMCRFIIGTITAGWTEKDCDYLCDGVDDQVEINAAIQALPSTGGEIKVLDGTYNITASINIDKERVTFGGCGQSTIFKRMWNSTAINQGVIELSKNYSMLKYFVIDGNKSLHNSDYNHGIDSKYQSLGFIVIKNTTIINCSGCGIQAIYLSMMEIISNLIMDNILNGIRADIYSGVIANNICYKNGGSGINTSAGYSISIVGNRSEYNAKYGIYVDSDRSTICGNTCNNNEIAGIRTHNSTATSIIGNTCIRGKGTASDYTSSQRTIEASTASAQCVIVGNTCLGKAPTIAGTNCIVENNLS